MHPCSQGSHRRPSAAFSCLAVAVVTAVVVVTAQAADQPIGAIKLILKSSPSGVEKMVFVSKDPALLFPALGGLDDPANGSPGGAIIDILTRDGGNATFTIPAGESPPPGWKAKDGASVDLYKYVNRDAPVGPTELKVVVLKETKVLKLVGKAVGLPLTGTLGDVVVRVTTGSVRNCARFDASTIRRDEPGKFIAKGALSSALTDCGNGPPSTSSVLRFVMGAGSGACGEARRGGATGTILKSLACGSLDVGGGCAEEAAQFPFDCGTNEGSSWVAGATTTFRASCPGTTCTIEARTAAESGSDANCSSVGCQFGTFVSTANGSLSTCARYTFQHGGGPQMDDIGTLDLTTGAFSGSFPLASELTLTNNHAAPCPECLVGGIPGQGAGVCSGAAENPGVACTGLNPSGDNYECSPSSTFGGIVVGVNLAPITTGTALMDTTTDQDQVPGGAVGQFCQQQNHLEPGSYGCFALGKEAPAGAEPICDYIEMRGSHAVGISIGGGPVAATLGSVFCMPTTGNLLLDRVADVPGPGATTLPGTLELIP